MKKSLILFIIYLPVLALAQGAGSALNFDGTNDYVSAGAIGTTHTIEFWVNSTNLINGTATATPIMSFNGAINDKYIWINDAFGAVANETITFGYGSGATGQKSYITTVLQSGWNHVAVVSNGTIYDKVYINGVSVTVSQSSGNALVANISTIQMGARTNNGSGGAAYYRGELDEVRFWSTQRTQTQIRDNMCKRLIGNEAGLIGYYTYNNASGTTVSDVQTNVAVHNGTATNFAMSGATSNWVTSSAPIGNESTYLYTGSWAGQTLTLSSTANGSVQVNTVSGTVVPTGIQLYRVSAVPNSTSGISGLGTNNVYWGNFIIGATSPTYTAVYDYTNFNYIAPANEGSLVLNNRDHNADATWSNISATLNTTTNTLTRTGVTTRLEFILSNTSVPLPIELIDFKVNCVDDVRVINWTTASETNNDIFTLERCNFDMNWIPIKIIKGAGNSTFNLNYKVTDSINTIPTYYYRLKQTDYDGMFTYSKIIYSACSKNQQSDLIVSPNPNKGVFEVNNIEPNTTLEIINGLGKILFAATVNQRQLIFNMPELSSGIYTLRSRNSQGIKNFKLLITK